MGYSYHHWDEEEEYGNKWCWYFVSMYDMFTDDPLTKPLPVFAEGFQEAMTIYEVLYKQATQA